LCRHRVGAHLWYDLEPDELVRLFILLNAGQQKVSARHLLEVERAQLSARFRSRGLRMMTERNATSRSAGETLIGKSREWTSSGTSIRSTL
jgi:hypothetical protein